MMRICLSIILAILVAILGWWCCGRLPARVVQPVVPGHWLAHYVRGDGTIDTAAALRDQRGVPGSPDANLAALLVEVAGPTALSPDPSPDLIKALGMTPEWLDEVHLELPEDIHLGPGEVAPFIPSSKTGRVHASSPPTFEDALTAAGKKPWRDSDLPTVAAWLDRQQSILHAMMAWKPTCCCIPLMPGQDARNANCLRLLPIHYLGLACAAEAFRSLALGDTASAVRYAAILHGLGSLAANSDSLINTVIGSSMMRHACDVMDAVMVLPSVSDSDLAPWLEVDGRLPWNPDVGHCLDCGERLLFVDALQQDAIQSPIAKEPTVILRRFNDFYDRLAAVARIPAWRDQKIEWGKLSATELDTISFRSYDGRWAMVKLICAGPFARREIGTEVTVKMALAIGAPALLTCAESMRLATARLALIRTAIALHHNPDANDWPADPFGNGPLCHRKNESNWSLWSVGRDGIDDQGVAGSDDVVLNLPATP